MPGDAEFKKLKIVAPQRTPQLDEIDSNIIKIIESKPLLFIGAFIVIGFILSGGYMVTADTEVSMSGQLGFVAVSVLLLLAGASLAILNIKHILRQSDPLDIALFLLYFMAHMPMERII